MLQLLVNHRRYPGGQTSRNRISWNKLIFAKLSEDFMMSNLHRLFKFYLLKSLANYKGYLGRRTFSSFEFFKNFSSNHLIQGTSVLHEQFLWIAYLLDPWLRGLVSCSYKFFIFFCNILVQSHLMYSFVYRIHLANYYPNIRWLTTSIFEFLKTFLKVFDSFWKTGSIQFLLNLRNKNFV